MIQRFVLILPITLALGFGAPAGGHPAPPVATDAAAAAVTLSAPKRVEAGLDFEVEWTGPGARGDQISITWAGQKPSDWADVEQGHPVQLTAPLEPHVYQLRYYSAQSDQVIARHAIKVVAPLADATLDAPASAPAGSTIDVAWTGPGHKYDYIIVSDPEGQRRPWHFMLRDGNPRAVKLPAKPGSYELRYVDAKGRALVSRSIEVTAMAQATLDAVASAPAGSTIELAWTGPGYDGDYLVVTGPDGEEADFQGAAAGSPVQLRLPARPGTYELRYMFRKRLNRTAADRVLASRPIRVTEVTATLDAPATAQAGSTIQVAWTGPGYDGDIITLARPDADLYTSSLRGMIDADGGPVELHTPDQPGNYEVRYVLDGPFGAGRILARQPIEIARHAGKDDGDASIAMPAAADKASAQAVEACATRSCFTDNFQACQPAAYTIRNMMGSARYRIIGAAGDGCRVELTYLGNPNPAWVGKPLACTYDDSLEFRQAAMQALSSAVSGGAQADCEGPLLDVL